MPACLFLELFPPCQLFLMYAMKNSTSKLQYIVPLNAQKVPIIICTVSLIRYFELKYIIQYKYCHSCTYLSMNFRHISPHQTIHFLVLFPLSILFSMDYDCLLLGNTLCETVNYSVCTCSYGLNKVLLIKSCVGVRDGNSSENFTPRGIEESRNGKIPFLGDRGR